MKSYYRSFTRATVAALFFITLYACPGPSTKKADQSEDIKGTISISGAWALYPMTVKWAEEFQKIHPGVRIDISAGGAGKGFTDAMTSMVELGMFSRGFSQAELDQGVWFIGVTKDAVIPVVNDKNPFLGEILKQGISQDEFRNIFMNQTLTSWAELLKAGSNEKIHLFTRSDACGAAEMWAAYLGKHQEDLKGTGVFGDPGIANAVKNDLLGMGYNNVNYVFDLQTRRPYPGLVVIPIDLNNNDFIDTEENFYNTLDSLNEAIRNGVYPSPPARPLYFVSKGKPQKPEVIVFLKWILESGQQYVEQAGYVPLPDQMIENELLKLK